MAGSEEKFSGIDPISPWEEQGSSLVPRGRGGGTDGDALLGRLLAVEFSLTHRKGMASGARALPVGGLWWVRNFGIQVDGDDKLSCGLCAVCKSWRVSYHFLVSPGGMELESKHPILVFFNPILDILHNKNNPCSGC